MIYGNVNVDMNPDGLGAWEDIPTHVQVAGVTRLMTCRHCLQRQTRAWLPADCLSPMSVIKSKQEILSKNYQDCLIVKTVSTRTIISNLSLQPVQPGI